MKWIDCAFCIPPASFNEWLPDMDLNHDKQIQSLLCYRYTIGHAALGKAMLFAPTVKRPSRTGVPPVSDLCSCGSANSCTGMPDFCALLKHAISYQRQAGRLSYR